MQIAAARLSKLTGPTALVMIASLALILMVGTSIWLTAANIEQDFDAREEQLIGNGIKIEIARVNGGVESQTLWDDAVLHLDNRLDPKWAKQYLTEYLWANGQYNLVYVLDGADRPVYATEDRASIDLTRFEALRSQLAPVIASVRRREVARGPLFKGDPRVPTPIRDQAIVRSGSNRFIVTADLVQPDNSIGAAPSRRGAILLAGQRIDSVFLHKIEQEYLVHDLRTVPDRTTARPDELSLRIGPADDPASFRLAWKRNSPTARLLLTAGPSLALVILALASAPLIVLASDRRNQKLKTASEAAKLASQAKSGFLATMSHEIRTPMNGIIGMARIMQGNALEAAQREWLEIILTSSEALVSILNDALDLSKIESGKLELENEPFAVSDLAQAAASAFSAIAIQKGLNLVAEVSPRAEGTFRGDAHRIRQILHNLLSNAIKFTEHGRIVLGVDVSGSGLEFVVSDTGCGIAPGRIDRLFEKFVQEDASTTRRFGGSGLGLAICKDLTQAMGGTVSVRSQLGEGTTFHVWLPLERCTVQPVPGTTHRAEETLLAAAADSALRVLVAEDNSINQRVIVAVLEQVGIVPTVVEDGAAAVEAWAARHWDLILMDVCMPVMDGVAAARRIRSREAVDSRDRTPIVALTANVMSHQIEEYRQAGIDGVVAKPILVSDLFDVIEQALGGDVETEDDTLGAEARFQRS
jgi:signal transduction histidine kinase/FixJ family two-component response regulator